MSELSCASVVGAIDGVAVTDDGKHAFVYDRLVNKVVKINLATGERVVLQWSRHDDLQPKKLLCYALFHFTSAEDRRRRRLAMLAYHAKHRLFHVVPYCLDPENVLRQVNNFAFRIDNIQPERLAYSAHRHGAKLEIIFYQRYDRQLGADALPYAHVTIDLTRLEMRPIVKGTLPLNGKWQMPFVSGTKLSFLSLDKSGATRLASLSITNRDRQTALLADGSSPDETNAEEMEPVEWSVTPLDKTPDSHETPNRWASWCHTWELPTPIFVLTRQSASQQKTIVTLWAVDMANFRWHKLLPAVQLPLTAQHFTLRSTTVNTVLLHYDDPEANKAAFVRFDVARLMQRLERPTDLGPIQELSEPETYKYYADVICPICWEMYTDPRTLFCGHALCFACLNQMRERNGVSTGNVVKCPNCRKITKIPEIGLPTNFALRDAIDLMRKAQEIREAGVRCSVCHGVQPVEELFVCTACSEPLSVQLPESSGFFCSVCIQRHRGHPVKRFDDFLAYSSRMKSFVEECEVQIQQSVDQASAVLHKALRSNVIDKLTERGRSSVRSFVDQRVFHDPEIVAAEADAVQEAMTRAVDQLALSADATFLQLLEDAVRRPGHRFTGDDRQTLS